MTNKRTDPNSTGSSDLIISLLSTALITAMYVFSMRPVFYDEYLMKQRLPPKPDFLCYLVGFLLIFISISLLLSFIRPRFVTLVLFFIPSLVISVANYYEFRLRGTVLTYEDLHNAVTAARMLRQYDLQFTTDIFFIFLIFLLMAALTCFCVYLDRKHPRMHLNFRYTIEWLVLLILFFVYCFLSGNVIPKADPWSWEELYAREGFVTGSVSFILTNMESPIKKPYGYDDPNIVQPQTVPEDTRLIDSSGFPDIIMILNETWYDLDHLISIDTDVDYMSNYNKLDADKGFAVVPISGGGTNNSEYELLTSNSMSLLNTYSPYIYLSLSSNDAVTGYLKNLGYKTMAAHSEQGTNYDRSRVWSELGFDEIHFSEDFSNLKYSGKRERATDSSVFDNVSKMYENMTDTEPRFVFLLTIQNHGGWNCNPPEMDTVHLKHVLSEAQMDLSGSPDMTAPDDLNSVINEYLSSIYLTDIFIKELTDYYDRLYETEGRKVMICMVGDHAPEFVRYIRNPSISAWEAELRRREVPYFIWSNYGHVESSDRSFRDKTFDLCCLMPFVLRSAGLPKNSFYNNLCSIGNAARCFTNVPAAEGDLSYVDRSDNIRSIYENEFPSEKIRDYFYSEYGNIRGTEKN